MLSSLYATYSNMYSNVLLALPGLAMANDIGHESHYCVASLTPEKLTCLSLDASDVAVFTEATTIGRVSQSWGPLTRWNGKYHKSASESFYINRRLISTDMQMDGKLTVSMTAVEHKAPKSLASITSHFAMNEPNCTIEFSSLRPYSTRVHWNGAIHAGKVAKEYPYTITWDNGQGVGFLVEMPEWYHIMYPGSSNPYFILAEYKPKDGQSQRVLILLEGKYWTDDRLREW